jgi:hypothetical protein
LVADAVMAGTMVVAALDTVVLTATPRLLLPLLLALELVAPQLQATWLI